MDPPARMVTTTGEQKEVDQVQGQDEEKEAVGVVEEKEEAEVVEAEEKKEREIVDLTNEPPHTAIRAQAHKTYVAQAQKMVDKHNKKSSLISTYAVGQYVSVTIEMGDHPNRLPQRNIVG